MAKLKKDLPEWARVRIAKSGPFDIQTVVNNSDVLMISMGEASFNGEKVVDGDAEGSEEADIKVADLPLWAYLEVIAAGPRDLVMHRENDDSLLIKDGIVRFNSRLVK